MESQSARPMLARAPVAVWLAEPAALLRSAPAPLDALLAPEEQARLERAPDAPGARRRTAGRLLARLALARHRPVLPSAWRFAAEPGGRLRIAAPSLDVPLHFNLSHTSGLVACAVREAGPVGVDVEALTGDRPWQALAARFFAPDEARSLAHLGPAERRRRFLLLWTLKEAVLKARGEGLAGGLARVALGWAPGTPPVLRSVPDDEVAAWMLHAEAPTGRHLLAVAWRGAGEAGSIRVRWLAGAPDGPPAG